jgi:CRP-like cAMP-binding protein
MAQAEGTQPPTQNWLLAALTPEDWERLSPHMEVVFLPLKEVLYEPNEPVHHVYFPLSGVYSLLSVMENKAIIEFATVGKEGMAGLPVFLEATSMPSRAISQVAGDSVRVPAAVFKEAVQQSPAFERLLLRYTQALFNQVVQSAACNRLHAMNERCARWLLLTHDRAGTDQFVLTHEFLAQMLGVRRATVTVTAGILQQAGLIRYSRGRLTILNRLGLEAASCECYAVIRREYERLVGGDG